MPAFDSCFARRFVRPTGALELMEDLGSAGPGVHMLGGGNPARIPAVEAVYRRRPAEMAGAASFFKYHVHFDGLDAMPEVAAICVSRPTHPSGNVLSLEELQRLDALARIRRVPLIIDAPYGEPFPGIQFRDPELLWNENVILCLSLSKLGLPATPTGIAVAAESTVAALTAFNATAALAPGSTGPVIVEPLLASGELDVLCREVIRPYYRSRAEQAVEWLRDDRRDLPLRIHRPEGAFFLWLWFPGLPVTSHELYVRLKARGVLVLSGHHFFPGLAGSGAHRNECLRINYSQDPTGVRAGIRLIAEEARRAFAH